MGKILSKINETESSTKKSYEVCKNITVYSQGQSNSLDGNEYLDEITPILDNIISEVKEILDSSFVNIKKILVTGAGTIINNVDLYFQEYITNCSCEVLKPYFIQAGSIKIPVKEYIEVNSAIALALNGLGNLNKDLNFIMKQPVQVNDIKSMIKSKLSGKKGSSGMNVDEEMPVITTTEKLLIRLCVVVGLLLVGYMVFANYASTQISDKKSEVMIATSKTNGQLTLMDMDKEKIDTATSAYSILLENLKKLSDDVTNQENNRIIAKDAIPNLLNKIMFVMPQRVKIVSIENVEEKHIVIELESEEYEQLGYFMAAIKTGGILENVKSTSGTKDGAVVKVVIEGDLP